MFNKPGRKMKKFNYRSIRLEKLVHPSPLCDKIGGRISCGACRMHIYKLAKGRGRSICLGSCSL